jgi:hypothetical protein
VKSICCGSGAKNNPVRGATSPCYYYCLESAGACSAARPGPLAVPRLQQRVSFVWIRFLHLPRAVGLPRTAQQAGPLSIQRGKAATERPQPAVLSTASRRPHRTMMPHPTPHTRDATQQSGPLIYYRVARLGRGRAAVGAYEHGAAPRLLRNITTG